MNCTLKREVTHREGNAAAGEVRLQLLAVGAVADKGQVRAGRELLQHVAQRLQVLLCTQQPDLVGMMNSIIVLLRRSRPVGNYLTCLRQQLSDL